MGLDELEKLKLCTLPTPLMEAPSLSAALGGPRILIKRDDLTGLAMGGNKARPMEFIMTEAKQQKADVLVAAGYQGSNWVSNLVAAARKTSMEVVLFLLGETAKCRGISSSISSSARKSSLPISTSMREQPCTNKWIGWLNG